jgi:hypothetical protein
MNYMSCGKRKFDTESCVADILKRVADAQDEVENDGDCDTSCHKSIQDLLAGATTPTTFDTIPLILYCECDPFLGTGVRLLSRNTTSQTLQCIETFFFRVSKVDDNCAKLELLTTTDSPNGLSKHDDPCDQINTNGTTFFRTGICMTVDLNCFCAVVCLDPVATRNLPIPG